MSYDKMTGHGRGTVLVYVGGTVTSAATLALLFFLRRADFNLLAIFFIRVLPAGGTAAGLLAASGYSIVAWKTNVRVTTASLFYVGLAGIFCFFLAHYVTYLAQPAESSSSSEQVSFLEYLRLLCEEATSGGSNIGKWGYFLQSVSGIGFAVGGIIPHIVLRLKSYCEKCQLYMRQIAKGVLSSKVMKTGFRQMTMSERNDIVGAAMEEVIPPTNKILEAVAQNGLAENRKLMESLPPERDMDSLAGVTIVMNKCPNCENHLVKATMYFLGMDKRPSSMKLGTAAGLVEGARDLAATVETIAEE